MSKTILITGSSTGFGKLTAQTLAKSGHQVIATMRGVEGKNATAADELKTWAKQEGVTLEVIELDVTSDSSVSQAANYVEKNYRGIDAVINNAGIYGGGLTESYSLQDFKNIFEVNVFGSLRVVHAFLPAMRKQGSGLFVQVSSIMGRIVVPFSSAYTSSKWAIEAIAESLRYELAALGIDSVIVQPGAFPTEIFQKIYQPEFSSVTQEYGPAAVHLQNFSNTFSTMMSAEDLPNEPQHVADAILNLVNTPTGTRPLRVTVDKIMVGLAESINETQSQVQKGLLTNLGLAELLQTRNELVEA